VLVTLQCCKMCAALVCAAADHRGNQKPIEVTYLNPDPGSLAKDTILQQRGWERRHGGEEETWDDIETCGSTLLASIARCLIKMYRRI